MEVPGQKLNGQINPESRKMTAERCALLYAVALANNVPLSWSGIFPVNIILYLWLYHPNLSKL